MTSKLIIQILLISAVAGMGWMMLRSPGGARHLAARRLATAAFIVFAIAAIAFPGLVTHLAHLVGVGRGTDLLLYLLVLAFLAQVLSSFRRNAARERQITRLARAIALSQAPSPGEISGQGAPSAVSSSFMADADPHLPGPGAACEGAEDAGSAQA